jgi:LmbE family N-acetylglucosaminyl deacetylase
MLAFEAAAHRFDAAAMRAHASQFDRAVFRERLRAYVERRWTEFLARPAC